jgi:hypothetical protein
MHPLFHSRGSIDVGNGFGHAVLAYDDFSRHGIGDQR